VLIVLTRHLELFLEVLVAWGRLSFYEGVKQTSIHDQIPLTNGNYLLSYLDCIYFNVCLVFGVNNLVLLVHQFEMVFVFIEWLISQTRYNDFIEDLV
jgi:hypothetical protein